ncbi:MAG: hypothetical protein ACXABY_21805 [Candidatus Thorarchaeota archaeon]
MSDIQIDWYDTGFATRQTVPLVFSIVILLCIVLIAALMGLLNQRVLIVLFTLIPLVIVVGWLAGYREAEKRFPTSVGISNERIKLLYRRRSPKEIPWQDVSGVIVKGRLGTRKVIQKDGQEIPLPVPAKIATTIKERFNRYQDLRQNAKESM